MSIEEVHAMLTEKRLTLSLAESCTGGAIASALTAIPGASNFLLGSLVVYSDAWKQNFLGVSEQTLKTKGAVSAETVEEMLRGLLEKTTCDIAAAVSGIAGPTGGTPEKPVGTIYIGVVKRGEKPQIKRISAPQSRSAAINFAMQATLKAIYNVSTH